VVTNVLEINPERLWDSLERSAEIGRFRDVGLRRLALSAEDKEMRDLFVEWARTAGCSVEIDRLGNIFARRAGSDPSLPPVAIGSHLDTQICGGRYDGILGVLCGLEVVRTLNDRNHDQARHRSHLLDQRGRCALQPTDDGFDGLRQGVAHRERAGDP
jgi:N-carbamoyl-L-amino-acid hydrolase